MFTKIAQKIAPIFFSAIFLIQGIQSYAGTIDPTVPDAKYIEFGKKFDCVVKISGVCNDGSLFGGSAIVIDKHHVITAAHVVEDIKICVVKVGEEAILVNEVIIHKDYHPKKFGVADIALGYCEAELIVDVYPKLYEKNDELNKICSVSGYGFTGNFKDGINKHDGEKRAGSNRINGFDRDLLVCDASRKGTKGHTVLEYLICGGDSGGGLFIDGKLAGVNSIVMSNSGAPLSKYDNESGHTRVSKFVEWINENKRRLD